MQVATDTVIKRGLVNENIKYKDILKEYKAYCETEREIKHFSGPTLAYVTPVCMLYVVYCPHVTLKFTLHNLIICIQLIF